MVKSVMVTGATGFVGKRVLDALSKRDVQVIPVVRTGKENQISITKNIPWICSTNDLFSEDWKYWSERCQGIDTIIHAAWFVKPGEYLSSKVNIDCLIGSLELARGAVDAGVRRFIGVGTCFEYDLNANILTVDSFLGPTSLYAETKRSLYTSLTSYFNLCGVEFAWCRLFYLYGEGEHFQRLVPYIRCKLTNGEHADLTSGKQIRDFMDVSIAGSVIVDVALSSFCGPFNVCSGKPVSVRELAESIADEFGRRDLLRFGVKAENQTDPLCVIGLPSRIESVS